MLSPSYLNVRIHPDKEISILHSLGSLPIQSSFSTSWDTDRARAPFSSFSQTIPLPLTLPPSGSHSNSNSFGNGSLNSKSQTLPLNTIPSSSGYSMSQPPSSTMGSSSNVADGYAASVLAKTLRREHVSAIWIIFLSLVSLYSIGDVCRVYDLWNDMIIPYYHMAPCIRSALLAQIRLDTYIYC